MNGLSLCVVSYVPVVGSSKSALRMDVWELCGAEHMGNILSPLLVAGAQVRCCPDPFFRALTNTTVVESYCHLFLLL